MNRFLLLTLWLFVLSPLYAQISHGGSPMFFFSSEQAGLRSLVDDPSLFVEMPPFDLDSVLRKDTGGDSLLRGAYRFAHKFCQNIEKGKSGHHFVLADGTKVWQVGIRSKGAHSINLLFSEFRIPEGGKLFLYSADQSHILGSFTHENNNEDGILPTAPVYGDEIFVEYSEPANAPFEAKLKISEVNHDYRGILRKEPNNGNSSNYSCMPDILCSEGKDAEVNRSAVLLIINGTVLCSGSLINNTSNDGTPYLLTAMHCFNLENPVHYPIQHYIDKTATVVAFFNYNRPVCNTTMRGVEEMSVAGALARCIIEPLDIALLELKETPPDYYRPYYAGWNLDPLVHKKTGFVTNIHHPNGDLSKYGRLDEELVVTSFDNTYPLFASGSFWGVPGWTIGSTAGGSSGSPLFDDNNLIIGALTGGSSFCRGNRPNGGEDAFSILHLGWKYRTDVDSLRLDIWLDKDNTGQTVCVGKEGGGQILNRISNADYNSSDQLEVTTVSTTGRDYLFGANKRNTVEFAEAFLVEEEACQVHGAYILMPPLTSFPFNVNIHLYNADGDKPGDKVASTVFRPTYTDYSGAGFTEPGKNLISHASESFVRWEGLPTVGKRFFIGYELPDTISSFLVYNTLFANGNKSTAWIKDPDKGWTEVSRYTPKSMNTALAIQALVSGTASTDTSITGILKNKLYYDYKKRTVNFEGESGESGIIRVYDISGRLLREVRFKENLSEPITDIVRNTVGIIRLESDRRNQKLKVIF